MGMLIFFMTLWKISSVQLLCWSSSLMIWSDWWHNLVNYNTLFGISWVLGPPFSSVDLQNLSTLTDRRRCDSFLFDLFTYAPIFTLFALFLVSTSNSEGNIGHSSCLMRLCDHQLVDNCVCQLFGAGQVVYVGFITPFLLFAWFQGKDWTKIVKLQDTKPKQTAGRG